MLVKNSQDEVLGFKVIHSKLFDKDPYYIPVAGYENLLIFNELYKKYLSPEAGIAFPSELLIISPHQFN